MLLKQYPPLTSWIVCGALIASLFVICDRLAAKYGEAISFDMEKKQAAYLLDHAVQTIGSNPDKTQIVAVGSSIVGYGVACASEYGDQYANVCLNKLYLNSHTDILKLYDAVDAFDSLLMHPPDILLIQIDLLAYNFETKTLHEHFFRGANFLYDLNAAITNNSHKYKMPKYCGAINKGIVSDTTLYKYEKMELVSFEDKKYIHNKLEALSKKGVKIYLIHVPRPSATESILLDKIRDQKFDRLITEYSNLCKATYIEFPEKLEFKYFYDFGHLNFSGRKKYSDWLYSTILKK